MLTDQLRKLAARLRKAAAQKSEFKQKPGNPLPNPVSTRAGNNVGGSLDLNDSANVKQPFVP